MSNCYCNKTEKRPRCHSEASPEQCPLRTLVTGSLLSLLSIEAGGTCSSQQSLSVQLAASALQTLRLLSLACLQVCCIHDCASKRNLRNFVVILTAQAYYVVELQVAHGSERVARHFPHVALRYEQHLCLEREIRPPSTK